MPHERLGEGVCTYPVMKAGRDRLSVDGLRSNLIEARLAKQKWPERVEIRASLPGTASGKVRKDFLRRELRKVDGGRRPT